MASVLRRVIASIGQCVFPILFQRVLERRRELPAPHRVNQSALAIEVAGIAPQDIAAFARRATGLPALRFSLHFRVHGFQSERIPASGYGKLTVGIE